MKMPAIKLKLEDWIAIGSVVMIIMFTILLFSFYNFLIGPDRQGPQRVVDPGALQIQIISISGAPGTILAGVTVGMGREYGSRFAGILLLFVGILELIAMSIATGVLPNIKEQYVLPGMVAVPYVSAMIGAAIAGMGGYLLLKAIRSSKTRMDQF